MECARGRTVPSGPGRLSGVSGTELDAAIRDLFADPAVGYLHIHNARPGCHNCRVDRA
jgi:hypothetical protein